MNQFHTNLSHIPLLTSSSLLFSIGLTLQIIFTTFRDSMSSGSGDADFTDSAVSGEMARGRGVGGWRAENAVSG